MFTLSFHRYDKKPLFRYSGCHHYDASAFNIALGVMFSYDTQLYLASTSPFIRVLAKPQPDADASLAVHGDEEDATNTSTLRDAFNRKSLGSGRRAERTFAGIEVIQRQLHNSSASRANSRRLKDKERGRSRERSNDKHVSLGILAVATDSLQRRSGDDGSGNTY